MPQKQLLNLFHPEVLQLLLMMEKYLNKTVVRKDLEIKMLEGNLIDKAKVIEKSKQ